MIVYISEFGVFIAIDASKVFILIIDYAGARLGIYFWGNLCTKHDFYFVDIGGSLGAGAPLNSIRISVRPGANELITTYLSEL